MLKWFLVLSLLIPTMGVSQVPPDSVQQDTTQFVTIPRAEFDQMLEDMRTLLDQEALKTQALLEANRKIDLLEHISRLDSLRLESKDQQIQSLEKEIELINEKLIDALDVAWWERKEFYYGLGILTMVLAQNNSGS